MSNAFSTSRTRTACRATPQRQAVQKRILKRALGSYRGIKLVPIGELSPHPILRKRLDRRYIERLGQQVPRLSYLPPIIADEDGSVAAYLDFYLAAKSAGYEVPVFPLARLTKKGKEALETRLVAVYERR